MKAVWGVVGVASAVCMALVANLSSSFFRSTYARPTAMGSSVSQTSLNVKISSFPASHRPEEALPFSDLVVVAEITEIGPARWNTVDGLRPGGWQFSPASLSGSMIYTPFRFQTLKVLKGDSAITTASSFAAVGGQVGQDSIDATEGIGLYADVKPGDQALLFLRTAEANLLNVAPYVYVDALRIDGNNASADCHGSHNAKECRSIFDLIDVLARVKAEASR